MDGWPQMDWVKLDPDSVLLDINNLAPLQRGAWAGIWLQLWRQNPPGLMKLMEPKTLQEWSGMGTKDWERNQVAVLAMYNFHPATGSLHSPKQQTTYLECAGAIMRKRAGGKAGAARKYGKRIGPTTMPLIEKTPYSEYKGDYWAICEDNWEAIIKRINEIKGSVGYLKHTYSIPMGIPSACYSNSSSTTTTDNATAAASAAPQAAAAAPGVVTSGAPGMITQEAITFTASMADGPLEAIRKAMLRWMEGKPEYVFFRGLYAKQPLRESPMLLQSLYEFSVNHPDLLPTNQAPTEAATDGHAS